MAFGFFLIRLEFGQAYTMEAHCCVLLYVLEKNKVHLLSGMSILSLRSVCVTYLEWQNFASQYLQKEKRFALLFHMYSAVQNMFNTNEPFFCKQDSVPLAWVNMTLFDFRNYLRQGQIKLHAWPVKDNLQYLNPIGTVVSNINTSTSPCLLIEFTQYAMPGTSVVYPPFDKVRKKKDNSDSSVLLSFIED